MPYNHLDRRMQVNTEVFEAVNYFIQRQALVAQAITELGLNIADIGKYSVAAWVWASSHDISAFEQQAITSKNQELQGYARVMRIAHTLHVPQGGIWYDQNQQRWHYFFHGKGCCLIHTETNEEIDWNCPDPKRFDPYFFLRHLEWQLQASSHQHRLHHTAEWIQRNTLQSVISIINELIVDGHITEDLTINK